MTSKERGSCVMWTRKEVKRRALKVMGNTYGMMLVVLLIYSVSAMLVGSISAGILSILLVCFMTSGVYRFFMRARHGKGDIQDLLFGFKYQPFTVFLTMLLVNVFVFLWTLLLVIPGLIKTYEYFCVPFILAENPNLEWKRIFELSRLMTDGDKLNIAVLQFSLIGWELLSVITFGLGYLFLIPYMCAIHAEVYAALRDKVLYSGQVSRDELPGFDM